MQVQRIDDPAPCLLSTLVQYLISLVEMWQAVSIANIVNNIALCCHFDLPPELHVHHLAPISSVIRRKHKVLAGDAFPFHTQI